MEVTEQLGPTIGSFEGRDIPEYVVTRGRRYNFNHAYPVDAHRSKMPQHVVAPSWSTCSQIEFGRPVGTSDARGRFHEKVRPRERVIDAPAGNVEEFRLDFDADEPAAKLHGCNASRTAAHVRVQNGEAFVGQLTNAPFHQNDGLLRRVFPLNTGTVGVYDPAVQNSHHSVIAGCAIFPRQLKGGAEHPIGSGHSAPFIPTNPAATVRQLMGEVIRPENDLSAVEFQQMAKFRLDFVTLNLFKLLRASRLEGVC